MPAPSRDPRQSGRGGTDTSHLFSAIHNAEIRSLFLPHGSATPASATDKKATGNGKEKVVAVALGNLCLPPTGIAVQEPSPTSVLNPLAAYWANNAVLCGGNPHGSPSGSNGNASSASTVTTVLENGQVLVHTLMDDQEGPRVVGSIDPPATAPSWTTVLNATGGGDGGAGLGELKLSMGVTCASFIPAEIAIQQFWQVHHTLAPGALLSAPSSHRGADIAPPQLKPTQQPLQPPPTASKLARERKSSSAFQEPFLPNRDTSSGEGSRVEQAASSDNNGSQNVTPRESTQQHEAQPQVSETPNRETINLVTSVADTLLGDDPIRKSWRQKPDAREALERHYSAHTGNEWRKAVTNHLWRGVVGTEAGEVFVFDGERYCFAFRCGAQRPSPTKLELDAQLSAKAQKRDDTDYIKVASPTTGTTSNASIVAVHAVMLPDESEGGLAAKFASNLSSASQSPLPPSSRRPHQASDLPSRTMSSMSMQTLPSDTSRFSSGSRVGFVTLQTDGTISVWKVKLPPSANINHRGPAPAPCIEACPIRLIQPSVLAKVRTLTVSHQYTIPMELSNYGPLFSASAGEDLGSQFGWEDPFAPYQHPFIRELESLLGESSAGRTSPPSAAGSYSAACTSAAFTPADYLPFISIIAFSGPGYDASVALRSGFGHVLDCDSKGDDITVGDSRLRHTTSLAMEGDCVLVARERSVHLISFGDRSIRKLMTTRSRVRALVLDRPLAIAGCQNGDIHVFASDNGTPLTTYSTYNNSAVKALSFHYQSLLLTVVDEDSGEVELVSLPGILLRFGVLPPEKMLTRQGTVLRHSMALQETPSWKVNAKRDATERKLLAKFSLANCVEQYLNFRTKLI